VNNLVARGHAQIMGDTASTGQPRLEVFEAIQTCRLHGNVERGDGVISATRISGQRQTRRCDSDPLAGFGQQMQLPLDVRCTEIS